MGQIDLKIEPQDIVLFHVGGSGGYYGPIDAVIDRFPQQCVVFGFEARETNEDKIMLESYRQKGVRTVLVNRCVAERSGRMPFFINKHGESSSMLAPSPSALMEHVVYPGIHTWGENTELERETTVDTISLQEFVGAQEVVPDVLSIDAQGMELHVMRGAGDWMRFANCVVSEVEFFEIYSGQALFDEQMSFLDGYGFRLTDLLNRQYWHPGPACNEGFLTVAEALWFRKITSFLELNAADKHFVLRGIKLSAVAFSFERYSYSYMLLKRLIDFDKALVSDLCRQHGFEILLKMVAEIDNKLRNYSLDNMFFMRNPLSVQAGARPRFTRKPLSHVITKVGSMVIRYLPV